jgi:Na+/alanine symporter
MNELNQFLSLIDSYIGGSQWFVFLLLGTGLFFTIYLKVSSISLPEAFCPYNAWQIRPQRR